MKRLLALLFLLSSNIALAQFTSVQRAELANTNFLGPYNSGFESGKQSWSASGGTFAVTSSNPLDGKTSAQWTPSTTGQNLDSTAISVPTGAQGGNCTASILYKGSDANTTFEVFDVTTSGIVGSASLVLTTLTVPAFATIPFVCPSSADSIKLRLTSTAASAQITFDKAFLGILGQSAVVTVSPVVYSQPKTAIVAVGSTGNNTAGHVLTTTDFAAATSTQYSFWNLAGATYTDGSGNGRTLTATGSPASGSGIFNTASTATTLSGSESLSTTSSFVNPGNTNSFSFGAWIKATWTSTNGICFGLESGSSDRVLDVECEGGFLVFRWSSGGTTYDNQLEIAETWADNTWHRIDETVSGGVAIAYLDGKNSGTQTGLTIRTASSPLFTIGSFTNTSNFVPGTYEEAFFVNGYAMTPDDIRERYALSIAHNKNLPQASQLWTGHWYRADSNVVNQLSSSWIVDQTSNTLYADFSDYAAGSFVDYEMQTFSQTATSAELNGYDSGWYSTTPAATLAHGLGGIPDHCNIQYEDQIVGASYEDVPCGNICSYDSTNLYCTWSLLSLGVSNQVRLTAWRGNANTVVPAAGASTNGLVNTSAQTFGGNKSFNGLIDPVGGFGTTTDGAASTSTSGLVTTGPQSFVGPKLFTTGSSNVATFNTTGSPFTLTSSSSRHQIYNLSGAGTVTMPTTGILAGEEWVIENMAPFDLTIKASNGSIISKANSANLDTTINSNGKVVLAATQATPTTPSEWHVSSVYEEVVQAANCTSQGSGGGTISFNVNIHLVRDGSHVTGTFQPQSTTVASGNNSACGTTFGPSVDTRFINPAISQSIGEPQPTANGFLYSVFLEAVASQNFYAFQLTTTSFTLGFFSTSGQTIPAVTGSWVTD